MMKRTLLAFLLAGGLATVASASTVTISPIGGGVTLNSGPMGANVWGPDQTVWSHASIMAAQSQLNNAGITTEGRVTFLVADTTHGTAFITLFDGDEGGQVPVSMGNLGMVSAAHGSNIAYLNAGANNLTISNDPPGSQTASGTVQWNANGGGNAFAWGNLITGNTMTFRFNQIPGEPTGLNDPNTFQFVTWTGSTWATVPVSSDQLSFTASGDYGFAAVVQNAQSVPLPTGGAMAGLSLLGLAGVRRRRR